MRLREARTRKLLTAQELAKKAGMADSTLYHVERGDWLPSLRTIKRLSKILAVDPIEVDEFKAAIERAAKK